MARKIFEQYEFARFDEKESLKWQLLKRKSDLPISGLFKNVITQIKLEDNALLEVYVNPTEIPYTGGSVTVTYGGSCIITYSNGFTVSKKLYLNRDIEIPTRNKEKEQEEKFNDITLTGEFNGNVVDSDGVPWIFGQVEWDGVTQLGLPKPTLKIDMNYDYHDNNDIPLNAKYDIIEYSDIIWSAKEEETLDGTFSAHTINNGILKNNTHFVGYVRISAYTEYDGSTYSDNKKIYITCNERIVDPNSHSYTIENVYNPTVPYSATSAIVKYDCVDTFYYYNGDRESSSFTSSVTATFAENTSDTDIYIDGLTGYYEDAKRQPYKITQEFNPHGLTNKHKYSIINIKPNSPQEIGANELSATFEYYCLDEFMYFNLEWGKSGFTSSTTITFESENKTAENISKKENIKYETDEKTLEVIQCYDGDNKIVFYSCLIKDVLSPYPEPKWNDTKATVKYTGIIYGHTETGKKKLLHEITTLSIEVPLETNDSNSKKKYEETFEWDVFATISKEKWTDIDTNKRIELDDDSYVFYQGYNPQRVLIDYTLYGEQVDVDSTIVNWNSPSVNIKYYGYCKFIFEEGFTVVRTKGILTYSHGIDESNFNDSNEPKIKNDQFKWLVTNISQDEFVYVSGNTYFPNKQVESTKQPWVSFNFTQRYNPNRVVSYYSYKVGEITDPNANYEAQTVTIYYIGIVIANYEDGKEEEVDNTTRYSQSKELTENDTGSEKPYSGTIQWDITELQRTKYIDKNTGRTQSSPVEKDYNFNQGYSLDNIVTGVTFELVQCDDEGQKADKVSIAYNKNEAYIPYTCQVKFETKGNDKIYNVTITGTNKGHYWNNIFTSDVNTGVTIQTKDNKEYLTANEKEELLSAIKSKITEDTALNKDVFFKAIDKPDYNPTGKTIALDCIVERGIGDIYLFYTSASVPTVKDGTVLDTTTVSSTNDLYKVLISKNVTSISDNLFQNCNTLQEFDAENSSVTTYPDNLFENCYSLNTVKLSENVTTIGNRTFMGCSSLTGITLGDKLVSIGDGAFNGCTSLTSVDIPNSVTSIGNWAFQYCYNLISIDIPNSVTFIGEYAFASCTSLTAATLSTNSDFNDIKTRTFLQCTELTGITIPSNVVNIEEAAFFGDAKMRQVNLTTGLQTIGNSAFTYSFSDSTINTLTTPLKIPNSVTSIGEYAFCHCTYLTGLELSTSLTTIEKYTFAKCNGGTIYSTGNSLTTLDVLPNIKQIKEGAFSGDTRLCNITIQDGLQQIGAYAFVSCYGVNSNVTDLIIPDSVNNVGDSESPSTLVGYSFQNCKYLKNVKFSKNVSVINISTFSGCTNMISCDLQSQSNTTLTTIDESAFSHCSVLPTIVYPDSLKYIRNEAFYYCSFLSEINITKNVQEIGTGSTCDGYEKVFSFCTSLGTITVDDTNQYYHDNDENESYNCCMDKNDNIVFGGYNTILPSTGQTGSKIIGQYAFYGNIRSYNTDLVIPSSYGTIEKNAFYYCDTLKSVTFNDGLKYIKNSAFAYCSGFIEITTPSTLEEIDYTAFYTCNKLSTLTLNENLIKIGVSAFEDCMSINIINIPDTVTYIGTQAFYKCNKASSIHIGASTSDIYSRAFSCTSSVETITIDTNNSTYKAESNTCLTKNGEDVIFGCCNSSIPSTVKTIKSYAFEGNIMKTGTANQIEFGDSLTKIESSAFSGCSSIDKVTYASIDQILDMEYSDRYSNPQRYSQNAYVGTELITSITFTAQTNYTLIGNSAVTSVTFDVPFSTTALSGAGNGNLEIILNQGITSPSQSIKTIKRKIKSITFGENVTSNPGNDTLYQVSANTVTFKCNQVFDSKDSDGDDFDGFDEIKVPADLVEQYKSSDIWSPYINKIKSM